MDGRGRTMGRRVQDNDRSTHPEPARTECHDRERKETRLLQKVLKRHTSKILAHFQVIRQWRDMANHHRQMIRPGSANAHAAKVQANKLEEMSNHDLIDLVQWLAHGTGRPAETILMQLAHRFPDHLRITPDGRVDLLEFRPPSNLGATHLAGMHQVTHQVNSSSMLAVGEAEHASGQRRQHPLGQRRHHQPLVIGDARWVIGEPAAQRAAAVADVQLPAVEVQLPAVEVPEEDHQEKGKWNLEKGKWRNLEKRNWKSPREEPPQLVSREKSMSCPPVAPYRSALEMFSQTSTNRQNPFRRWDAQSKNPQNTIVGKMLHKIAKRRTDFGAPEQLAMPPLHSSLRATNVLHYELDTGVQRNSAIHNTYGSTSDKKKMVGDRAARLRVEACNSAMENRARENFLIPQLQEHGIAVDWGEGTQAMFLPRTRKHVCNLKDVNSAADIMTIN